MEEEFFSAKGRMMGAAAVSMLHANEQFRIDLEAAKQELIRNK